MVRFACSSLGMTDTSVNKVSAPGKKGGEGRAQKGRGVGYQKETRNVQEVYKKEHELVLV